MESNSIVTLLDGTKILKSEVPIGVIYFNEKGQKVRKVQKVVKETISTKSKNSVADFASRIIHRKVRGDNFDSAIKELEQQNKTGKMDLKPLIDFMKRINNYTREDAMPKVAEFIENLPLKEIAAIAAALTAVVAVAAVTAGTGGVAAGVAGAGAAAQGVGAVANIATKVPAGSLLNMSAGTLNKIAKIGTVTGVLASMQKPASSIVSSFAKTPTKPIAPVRKTQLGAGDNFQHRIEHEKRNEEAEKARQKALVAFCRMFEMALLDDVITIEEKSLLHSKAQEAGIPDDEFEMMILTKTNMYIK